MLKQGLEWEAAYMLKNYVYIECKRLYDALCSDKYNRSVMISDLWLFWTKSKFMANKNGVPFFLKRGAVKTFGR